jgi:hypothetical protein
MVRTILVLLAIVILSAGAAAVAYVVFKPQASTPYLAAKALPDAATMETKRTIFISGHSLTDRPMPDFLSEIAKAAGRPIAWNGQHIAGSSIRNRSYGDSGSMPWSGFSAGLDPDGKPIDVIREWRTPSRANVGAYDILLITEQHRLLDSLLYQDTATFLREFEERFIASSPDGRTFFFTPWLDVSDKDDPRDWIAYERAAWPLWQCTIAGVNENMATKGSDETIHMVPASLALAALVEALSGSASYPGFKNRTTREITDAIFSDTVHLTPLGSLFVAAVTYDTLYGPQPERDVPTTLDPVEAATVQDFAAGFVDRYRSEIATSGERTCASRPSLAFIARYTGYIASLAAQRGQDPVGALVARVRDTLRFAWGL